MPPSALGCTSPLLKADQFDVNSATERIKCVLVGDGAVGKTSLVVSYSTNGFPNEYIPTAFDNYNVLVRVDGQPVSVQLCDTAGQDDFDPLRSLCYPDSDVFLMCFSVVNPTSFRNVMDKWLLEIRHHCGPNPPLVLVGTQSDRRRDARQLQELARYGQAPVTDAQARDLARRIGACAYVETSALTQRDLKEAFDQAILCALRRRGTLFEGGSRGRGGSKKSEKKKSFFQKLCCFS